MTKHKRIKKGHLITGEVEFTVVRDEQYFSKGGSNHSNEYRVSTHPTAEDAADVARQGWLSSCDAGRMNETYKVYRHTKGKTVYSHGHCQLINWPDFDYTNPKRKVDRTAPAPVPGPL